MRLFVPLAVSFCVLASLPANASFVSTPASLAPSDSVDWSQVGPPGTTIANGFTASSSGGIMTTLELASTAATLDQVCPAAACDYGPAAPGFNAGDSLILTEDASGNPSGPLFFTFSSPVRGAGIYLQLNAPGTFSAILTTFGGAPASEHVVSDSAGDPVFLGVVDSSADINQIFVSIDSCTASSPGICNPSDFAVDTLLLNTAATPEPAGFLLAGFGVASLLLWHRRRKLSVAALFSSISLLLATASLHAQVADTILPPEGAMRADGSLAVRHLKNAASNLSPEAANSSIGSPALPIWNYQLISPLNGDTYSGYMVGSNPFNRGARSTTIPVVLIPVIVVFHNTTSGFTATFDPTSTPDPGCTANQTALSLVENSPIFQNLPWTLNGTYVGNTQYIDAFQRANFWEYVKNTGNAYHNLLSYTLGEPLTLSVSYSAASLDHEVDSVPAGNCTNPTMSGVTNGGRYTGVVSINTIDAALNQYIAAQGITANQFPLFILYNVVMSLPDNPGFYDAGYHASQMSYPAVLYSPGQTYGIADIQLNQFFNNAGINTGTSVLAHEVAEWINDPGVQNYTPAWGHIGQQSGCQGNLEVGDPLTGTNLPPILASSGFNYYLQELVFYSWYFRIPAIGAGGVFSDNGTFTTDAGAVCQ